MELKMKEKIILIKNNVTEKIQKFRDSPIWENKWFVAAQLLVLFYFISFKVAYPVNQTVYHFFNGSLFQMDVLKDLSNSAFLIHSKMITLGFVLLVILLFKRNISLLQFTLTVVAVFILPIYEWIDMYGHETVFSLGLYNSIMREGATQVNPQYTRIVLFVIGLIALIVLVIRKKTRTMDRAFMLLITGSIIITTFLFHIAIPMGTLKISKDEKIKAFYTEIIEVPIGYACRNKNCYVLDTQFKQESKKILLDSIKQEDQDNFILEAKNYFSNEKNRNYPYLKAVGNFVGTDTTFSACIYRAKENKFLCTFDNQQMISQGLLAKIWFALLTAIAHFIWIFFGFGLLFLHKYRKIQKIVTSNM